MVRAQVVVGTPRRVSGMVSRGTLSLEQVKLCLVDECDDMLSRGLKEPLYELLQQLPAKAQRCLFACADTMPAPAHTNTIQDITNRFMGSNSVRVLTQEDEVNRQVKNIDQFYVNVEREDWKFETLCDLYGTLPMAVAQVVIYCNTRRKVDMLADRLRKREFAVSTVHGDMYMHGDTHTHAEPGALQAFLSGTTRILITTLPSFVENPRDTPISFVVNYDLPRNREGYLHRLATLVPSVGPDSSGSHGSKKMTIFFVTDDDVKALRELESFSSKPITELPMDLMM